MGTAAVVTLPLGTLLDRSRAKPILITGNLVSALGYAGLAFVDRPWQGFVCSAVGVAAIAGAADALSGSPIRGDLQAHLALTRLAEQAPAATHSSLMLRTTTNRLVASAKPLNRSGSAGVGAKRGRSSAHSSAALRGKYRRPADRPMACSELSSRLVASGNIAARQRASEQRSGAATPCRCDRVNAVVPVRGTAAAGATIALLESDRPDRPRAGDA
jgi:hypothetical protein